MKTNRRNIAGLLLAVGFLLGVKNGYLALWVEPDPQPYRIFPVRAETLPESIQQDLHHGIRIDSAQDLERLLKQRQ